MFGKKKLSDIMSGFLKAKTELQDFIDQQEAEDSRLVAIRVKADEERLVVQGECSKALKSLSKIEEILGE
jgi:hypothetical protein